MGRRVLGAMALTAACSSAFGYDVSVRPASTQFTEADGVQTVEVTVQRGTNDPAVACTINVAASTQTYSGSPTEAATANEDYVPRTANLTITIGGDDFFASDTFDVTVIDDTLEESLEYFDAVVDRAAGADCSGVVNVDSTPASIGILDDDSSPTAFQFVEPYVVDEAAGTATITLRRSGAGSGELRVYYRAVEGTATQSTDFAPATGPYPLVWPDGDTTDKTFTVPIVDDTEAEGDETVRIRATTDSDFVTFFETNLTITDDDIASAGFSTTAASAAEDGNEVVLTLSRTGSSQGAVSVDYATADGTATAGEDYEAAAGTVTWADGDAADKTIAIALIEDAEQEDAEDFVVNLTNVTGPANLSGNSSITVTIEGNDESRDIAGIATLSPNQRALAQWFDQTCPRIEALSAPSAEQQDLAQVCGALRDPSVDDADLREALDAINPEELLVSTFNALRLTALQHGNLSQRLNALRSGASGVNLAGLSLNISGQEVAGTALQEMFDNLVGGGASADESPWGRWGAFINGRMASGDQDESENEAGFDFDLYGVTAGVDYRVRQNFIVGLSAGFGSVDSDYDRGAGGLDIDSWNMAAYLTYFRDQAFYLDALATYGDNEYDSRRQIAFDTGGGAVERIGRGETEGTQYSLGFGSGWDFNRGAFTFGPHFGGYYFDVEVDDFAETGADGLNLAIDDQDTQSLTVNAGGHVSYAWLTDWGVLVPNAKVDWVHELEDNRETLRFRFVNDPFVGNPNDPSPTITLQGNRPDQNYFIWSVGLSAQFIHGFSGFVSYQSYAGYDDVSLGEWTMGARWEKTF